MLNEQKSEKKFYQENNCSFDYTVFCGNIQGINLRRFWTIFG